MLLSKWRETKPGLYRWEPEPGTVYECERINYRSQNYFMRINGTTHRTGRNKTYRAILADCKAICERHYEMNNNGGECP